MSGVLSATIDLAQVPVLSAPELRADILSRTQAGERLLTLYGRTRQDDVTLTAAFVTRAGALTVVRAEATAKDGYGQLTSVLPALHCFERELFEQTGLAMRGHPWLKPVRFQGQDQSAMSIYPHYELHGKEVHEVAVGPIHAGVIEPGSFRFSCLGEEVAHLEIQLGYQHRGVEACLLQAEATSLGPLVESICGDSSIAHTWAYAAATEALSETTVPETMVLGRAVLLELERVAMHLASLSGLAADIGFLQGASTYGRLRTTAINTLMRLTGSRFGRGAIRPFGLRLRTEDDSWPVLASSLAQLTHDGRLIDDCFRSALTVQHRLKDAGTLSQAQADEMGIVGLAARASGLPLDLRALPTATPFRARELPTVTRASGDCWARAEVRIDEVVASLAFLSGVVKDRASLGAGIGTGAPLRPRTLTITAVEGFRGEVVHGLETGNDGRLLHYKVQDPSLRNWMGLALCMRGNDISDFPIANKSFDLSYAGHDL
jgi:Ni,Fe-hydrogenase III large subunit